MRIAVFQNLPPGGAKRTVYEQIKILSIRNTIDLYQISTSAINYLNPSKFANNIFTFEISKYRNYIEYLLFVYFKLPSLYKNIAKKIDSNKYDVVIIHPCIFTQTPYLLKYLKTFNIYYCQEPRREFYEKINFQNKNLKSLLVNLSRYPIKLIDKSNISEAKLILANSKYSKNYIKKVYGLNSYVNYLGVDTNTFSPLNLSKKHYVLSVGAFTPLKGHDFVIKCISLIDKKTRPQLVIIGNDGNFKKYLLELSINNAVDLKILDSISESELNVYYNQAKILAIGSYNEPLGLTALEAMACNLTPIAINEGGLSEIIPDKNLLVERNYKKFAYKINDVLQNKLIPKINLRLFVEKNYTWNKSVNELEAYIRNFLID